MIAADLPLKGLAWLGRQGTRAIAVILFIGIAVPPIGAVLKNYVTEAVFGLLVIAFIRVNPAALRGHLRKPGLIVGVTAWTMVAVPLLTGGLGLAIGLDSRSPDLFLALMLQAVTSPMMAAPTLAALMGLDATLVLIALIATTAAVPITAPLILEFFVGPVLAVSATALGIKLFAILAGSAAVAAVLRRLIGAAFLIRRKDEIDGINIIFMYFFAASLMEALAGGVVDHPLLVLGLGVLGLAVTFLLLGSTYLLCVRAGRGPAFAMAMMVTQRNLGLMLAATAGILPDMVWLYFALAQFPIFLAPQLLMPLARRLGVGDGKG